MTPAILTSAIATTNPKAMPAAQPQATAANDSRRSSFERLHALTSRGHLRPRKVDRRLRAAPKIARVSAGKANATVPGRSREQRLRALRLANEIRSARAQLKKDLASGKIELPQILAQPPEYVRTARVRDVLLALPKIGSVKASRILADYGIAPTKTLGGLTERQRTELINRFRGGGHDE
jgi:hypothetical protein